MKIKRNLEAQAARDKLWAIVEDPLSVAARSEQKFDAKQTAADAYELKIPFKLGLFTIKIGCNLKIVEKRPKEFCRLEFDAKIPSGKLDGVAAITLEPKSESVTVVDIDADVSSGGAITGMLGGEDALQKRLDKIFDAIAAKIGESAT